MGEVMNINLGCGSDIRPGWVNVDYKSGPGVDLRFDLTKPFPLVDDCAQTVCLSHVLEHLSNWPEAVAECHRILRPGGMLHIRVPYGVGKHNPDADHVRFFWPRTIDVFIGKDSPGLDARHFNDRFERVSITVLRYFWFYNQIKAFRRIKHRFPIGVKIEIVYVLRKTGVGPDGATA